MMILSVSVHQFTYHYISVDKGDVLGLRMTDKKYVSNLPPCIDNSFLVWRFIAFSYRVSLADAVNFFFFHFTTATLVLIFSLETSLRSLDFVSLSDRIFVQFECELNKPFRTAFRVTFV